MCHYKVYNPHTENGHRTHGRNSRKRQILNKQATKRMRATLKQDLKVEIADWTARCAG